MTPEVLVRKIERLVSFPEAARKAQLLIDKPSTRSAELAAVILCDAALTARLLRLVNSPLYAPAVPIETVSQAISLIGREALRGLVLTTSAIEAFQGLPVGRMSMERFWRHAVTCAVASRRLAAECGASDAEPIFLAGLLHSLGKLIFFTECADQYLDVIRLIEAHPSVDAILGEEQVFGFNYADLSAALLASWEFPESIRLPVQCHLQPPLAQHLRREAELVHAAAWVASDMEQGRDEGLDALNASVRSDPVAIAERLQLPSDAITYLRREIEHEVAVTLKLLMRS